MTTRLRFCRDGKKVSGTFYQFRKKAPDTFFSFDDDTPDGARFLMLKDYVVPSDQGDTAQAQVVLVENWFSELERLVPAK